MGDSVRLLHCATPQVLATPGGLEALGWRNSSEHTAALLDDEAEQLLRARYREDYELLEKHRDELERIADALIERESLDEEDFRALLSEPLGKKPAQAGSAPASAAVSTMGGTR
jgi:cell division protease FtsH